LPGTGWLSLGLAVASASPTGRGGNGVELLVGGIGVATRELSVLLLELIVLCHEGCWMSSGGWREACWSGSAGRRDG